MWAQTTKRKNELHYVMVKKGKISPSLDMQYCFAFLKIGTHSFETEHAANTKLEATKEAW